MNSTGQKLLIISYVLIFVLSLMIPPTSAAVEYGKDFESAPASAPNSPKSFDENDPKNSTVPTTPAWVMFPGQTVKVDVYVRNVPQPLVGAGFWLDYDSSAISVTTVEIYDGGTGGDGYSSLPKPYTPFWDPTMSSATQISANELMILVATVIQVSPDADSDIVMARLTLECKAVGNTNLTFRVIEGFNTVVGTDPPPEGTTYDSEIVNSIVTIKQEVECLIDADCSDRLWCTGAETCINYGCNEGAPPCDDDDKCSLDLCREADPHCGSDLNCDEIEGVCKHPCAPWSGFDCVFGPICYHYICEPPPYWDWDCDDIGDDGDGSGTDGDHPCTGGQTENCDDNCWLDKNSTQADGDGDGAGDVCDNCPATPNGPYGGTCTRGTLGQPCVSNSECGTAGLCSLDQEDNDHDSWGDACDPDDDNDVMQDTEDNCPFVASLNQSDGDGDGAGDVCDNCPEIANPDQFDTYPPGGNGCGDACECESDLDDSGAVDGVDTNLYKKDYGRNPFHARPCTNEDPCPGDFDCSGSVDGTDTNLYKKDYGRNQWNNPCPACSGVTCSY